MTTTTMNLSKAALVTAYEELAAKNAELEAQLATKKSSRTRTPKAPKVVEKSNTVIQNADYVGRLLTVATLEEILSTVALIESNTKFPVYINISGPVRVDGTPQTFKKLMPVFLQENNFLLYGTENQVTPDGQLTFEKVRIVSMRDSVVKRYYLGEKPIKAE